MPDSPGGPATAPAALGIPELSIIVVTWNCRALALRCLAEIAASRIGMAYEVLVVDNASQDGTADAIAASFAAAQLIRSAENLGYARANNLAIERAAGRYLLLLNPDAFPSDAGSFARLVGFLEAHSEFAAAGCRLVYGDGRHQVGDAGYRPSALNVVIHALGISQFLPGGHGLFVVRPRPEPGRIVDVDWICGACLLVRAEAVRRFGALDASYFMYAEDVEFGCRLRDNGQRLAYLPGEWVIHLQGGTQGNAGASAAWLDNLGRLYARLNGGRHWFVFRAAMALGFGLRAVIYHAIGRLPGRGHLVGRARAMARYGCHGWRMAAPTVLAGRTPGHGKGDP